MNKLKTLSLLSLVAFSNTAFCMEGEASNSADDFATYQQDVKNAHKVATILQKNGKYAGLGLSALVGSGLAKLTYWTAQQKDIGYAKWIAATGFVGGSWFTYQTFRKQAKAYNTKKMQSMDERLNTILNDLEPFDPTTSKDELPFDPSTAARHAKFMQENTSWFSGASFTAAQNISERFRTLHPGITKRNIKLRRCNELEIDVDRFEAFATMTPKQLTTAGSLSNRVHEVEVNNSNLRARAQILEAFVDEIKPLNLPDWQGKVNKGFETLTSNLKEANRWLKKLEDIKAGSRLDTLEGLGLQTKLDEIDKRLAAESPIAGKVGDNA